MAIQINGKSLYEAVGGKPTLEKVHKIFYDKIYKHPWIGQYFKDVPQKIIETQQTDFMSDLMGGPSKYCGKLPVAAHKHMFIEEELFQLRSQLLRESLQEAQLSTECIEAWLKLDGAFKKGILKNSISECEKRFATDEILAFPNPSKKQAA
jgi:truncated hemoglobin YjbI